MAELNFSDFPVLVHDYLFYLETIKGRSLRTVAGYAVDLRTFLRFMKLYKQKIPVTDENMQHLSIQDIDLSFIQNITLSDIYEFLHYVSSDRSNNPKTRARKVSSIRGFYKYLTVTKGVLEQNPVKNLEMPATKKSLPKYLTLEQSFELLQHVHTKQPLRDFCILTLFLNCGMRLSELVGINCRDFNLQERSLRLLGKGNKERIIYLNDACVEAIRNYMEKERSQLKVIAEPSALFLSSRTGKRLGTRQVELIVQGVLKEAGLDNMGFSPHKLRHTAATLMYQHGNVDIRILKEILGHANIGTTEIYTHITSQNMQEAMNKNPLAGINQKKPKK